MKKLPSIIAVFIIVFISFFIFSYSFPVEKIKIKIENGVQVVYNPKNPAPPPGTPNKLILREELCIGDEEEIEDFMFSQIRSVQVDEEENIYVLDSKEICVKVFDKNGKHIRTFGKRGQGPGEIQMPMRMYLVAGKKIMIYDYANNRLSFYSLDGKCLREISAGKYRFSRTIPDSKGNIITQISIPGEKTVTEIKKFDPDLNPLITIKSIEEERTPWVINMMRPVLNIRVMKNDNIVWGMSSKYEIFVVSPEGKTLRKIVKDYTPIKISNAEKEKMIKGTNVPSEFKLKFPKNYNPFYFLIPGDEGRIYVRTYEKDNEGNFYYDVFDPEGRYIAKFSLPEIEFLYVVKKNKMYTMIWEDEEGIPLVKRYSVVWK